MLIKEIAKIFTTLVYIFGLDCAKNQFYDWLTTFLGGFEGGLVFMDNFKH